MERKLNGEVNVQNFFGSFVQRDPISTEVDLGHHEMMTIQEHRGNSYGCKHHFKRCDVPGRATRVSYDTTVVVYLGFEDRDFENIYHQGQSILISSEIIPDTFFRDMVVSVSDFETSRNRRFIEEKYVLEFDFVISRVGVNESKFFNRVIVRQKGSDKVEKTLYMNCTEDFHYNNAYEVLMKESEKMTKAANKFKWPKESKKKEALAS